MSSLEWVEEIRNERSSAGILSLVSVFLKKLFGIREKYLESRVDVTNETGLLNILLGVIAITNQPLLVDVISIPILVQKLERWGLPPRLQEELDLSLSRMKSIGRDAYLVEVIFSEVTEHSLVRTGEYQRFCWEYGVMLARPLEMSEEDAMKFLTDQSYSLSEIWCLKQIAQALHAVDERLTFRKFNIQELDIPA